MDGAYWAFNFFKPSNKPRLHDDVDELLDLIKNGSSEQDIIHFLISKNITERQCYEHCYTNGVTGGPVYTAAGFGRLRLIHILISRGFSPCNTWLGSMRTDQPIYAACIYGHLGVVRSLVEDYGVSVRTDEDTPSPIMVTLHFGKKNQAEIVQYLLESGAAVNSPSFNSTPLYIAVKKSTPEACQVLIKHGASVNRTNSYSCSFLHMAAERGQVDIIRILLDNGSVLNFTNTVGETPFLLATKEGHLDAVKFLYSRGAYPELSDMNLNTPLHVAVRKGYDKITKYLMLDIGVSLERRNTRRESPFYLAVATLNKSLVNVFLLCGYTPKTEEITPRRLRSTTEEAANEMAGYIEHVMSSPRSLQIMVCMRLRRIFRRNITSAVDSLPLPQLMKDNISLAVDTQDVRWN